MTNWMAAIHTVLRLGLAFFLVNHVHMTMTDALLFVVVTLLCDISTSMESAKKEDK